MSPATIRRPLLWGLCVFLVWVVAPKCKNGPKAPPASKSGVSQPAPTPVVFDETVARKQAKAVLERFFTALHSGRKAAVEAVLLSDSECASLTSHEERCQTFRGRRETFVETLAKNPMPASMTLDEVEVGRSRVIKQGKSGFRRDVYAFVGGRLGLKQGSTTSQVTNFMAVQTDDGWKVMLGRPIHQEPAR